MGMTEDQARALLEEQGQAQLLRYLDELDNNGKARLLGQIEDIDFKLMNGLIEAWIRNTPEQEHFDTIAPIPVIPVASHDDPEAREAWETGEDALREGKVGLFVVAGGQGTRLGYDGPKGAYPIGPVSKRSLFAFHAEKIHHHQDTYGCTLPWYIMTSEANNAATVAFFEENDYFGLSPENVKFFQQKMVPCVDEDGKFMLADKDALARNPNGHGGCLPALVDNGILDDCRRRGITCLSYFQVDNWAVKVADPYFIGYHLLRNAGMSSKNHRKNAPREAVGVHCLCDGQYRVIEYSELDIYPQLLETDEHGECIHYAGNPAIHMLSVDFVASVVEHFDTFPWHMAHKKVPHLDENGKEIKPEKPNAYKFETFVFDALRYCQHEPVALEIVRPGEYTPIKSYSGDNSVEAAWATMRGYWAEWLEAAGVAVPRDADGNVTIDIEISPRFALYRDEFVKKAKDLDLPEDGPVAIGPRGEILEPVSA